jgi:hypothetical protein
MRNPRSRWVAAALVALALLAFFAWRQWPDALRIGSGQATRTPEADMATPKSQSLAATAGVVRSHGASGNGNQASDRKGKDDDATCYSDYRQNLRDFRDRLEPARNADEAVDRLMLDLLATDARVEAWDTFGRASRAARQRWPSDVALAWLAYGRCGDGCDRDEELRRLLSVDPDNAAAWMAAMEAARGRHDEAGFAYALQRAANAKIYDSRMGVVFLHVRTMLARAPVPDSCMTPQALASLRRDVGREPTNDDRLDIMAFSLEAAIATPALSGIAGCAPRLGTPPLPETQRRQCNALLSRVAAQGDTLLEQQVAVGLLLRLETDPARLAALRERYRQLQWLKSVIFGKPLPEHYATRVWSQGEVATMQALAMERGLWPPPPGWLPDDPQARALITGDPSP